MQGSDAWHAERDSRIVRGSEAAACLNLMRHSRAHFERRCPPIPPRLAEHGHRREPEALHLLRTVLLPDEPIWCTGFVPLPEAPADVGSSPDALTLNAVVEIKAPWYVRYDDAQRWASIPIERTIQLELEMRCCGRAHLYYVLYFRRSDAEEPRVLVFLYARNDRLWDEFIWPRLQLFIRARRECWTWERLRGQTGPRTHCLLRAASYGVPAQLIHASHAPRPDPLALAWRASEPDAVETVLRRDGHQ